MTVHRSSSQHTAKEVVGDAVQRLEEVFYGLSKTDSELTTDTSLRSSCCQYTAQSMCPLSSSDTRRAWTSSSPTPSSRSPSHLASTPFLQSQWPTSRTPCIQRALKAHKAASSSRTICSPMGTLTSSGIYAGPCTPPRARVSVTSREHAPGLAAQRGLHTQW